jgi:hypothetical protein
MEPIFNLIGQLIGAGRETVIGLFQNPLIGGLLVCWIAVLLWKKLRG